MPRSSAQVPALTGYNCAPGRRFNFRCFVLSLFMGNFFSQNIDRRGRIVRAVFGVALVVGGLILARYSWWACGALVIFGGFAIYEAFRGWCLMRACGIK